jgi:hypothetical protein
MKELYETVPAKTVEEDKVITLFDSANEIKVGPAS